MIERSDENLLIRRAKAGEGRAIEALIQAHQGALYAFMLRMAAGRREIAEDIVQEAFVRVLKNLDRFDERFRFSTWLFTIAKRLYVNAMQKQKPLYDSDAVGAQHDGACMPGDSSERGETMANARDVIEAALAGLNAQQREIILLFHQQSWPITDIACHMGMPEGTVKSHLHRARQRMKRYIESRESLLFYAREVWS